MAKTLIFGGTTEGRLALLEEQDAVVSVTSTYAARLLPPGTDCRIGRLNEAGMRQLMLDVQPERVIDATHPFAVRVSENIRACCAALGVPCIRIERPVESGAWRDLVIHAKDAEAAAQMLQDMDGCILLTTGSQTLPVYTQAVPSDRLYVRVLPTMDALTRCQDAGIEPAHIIAMQGPFTEAFNAALYDFLDIQVMVTKDSGAAGGVAQKVLPALARGMDVILIDRPQAI